MEEPNYTGGMTKIVGESQLALRDGPYKQKLPRGDRIETFQKPDCGIAGGGKRFGFVDNTDIGEIDGDYSSTAHGLWAVYHGGISRIALEEYSWCLLPVVATPSRRQQSLQRSSRDGEQCRACNLV